jgi:hypothetical protein
VPPPELSFPPCRSVSNGSEPASLSCVHADFRIVNPAPQNPLSCYPLTVAHREVASVSAKPVRFLGFKDRYAVAATHGDVRPRTQERRCGTDQAGHTQWSVIDETRDLVPGLEQPVVSRPAEPQHGFPDDPQARRRSIRPPTTARHRRGLVRRSVVDDEHLPLNLWGHSA